MALPHGSLRALALLACVSGLAGQPSVHPMNNGGTPGGIPPLTDCNIRKFLWQAGQKLMPRRGTFKTLYDAMQLGACGVEPPNATDSWQPPVTPVPTSGGVVYVDAAKGSDTGSGTEAAPFQTIGKGVQHATERMLERQGSGVATSATIVLRAGIYHGCDGKGNVCSLGAAQSGLTIMNYPAEEATISGGQPLSIAAGDWKRVTPGGGHNGTQWKEMPNQNDVSDRAGTPTPESDTKCCKYLGLVDSLQECEAAAEKAVPAQGPFAGVTYHSAQFTGPYARHCYGVHQGDWITPVAQQNIDSAQNMTAGPGAIVYVADLNGQPGGRPAKFDGLRLGKQRAIRAKYPNGDPEKSGEW